MPDRVASSVGGRARQVVGDDRRPLERVAVEDRVEADRAGPAHRRMAVAGGVVPVADEIIVHRGRAAMLVDGRHPAERVMVGDEGGAVGVAEAARIAGIVVIIGHVAGLAVHVEQARRHLPERIVPGRHPLAVEAVEPGHGLKAQGVVIVVMDVAGLGRGEVHI